MQLFSEKLKPRYSVGSTDDSIDYENPSAVSNFEIGPVQDSQLLYQPTDRSKRYLGHHFPMMWRDGEPVLTIGPHWPFFICMWGFLLVAGIIVTIYIAMYQSFTIKFISVVLTAWEAFIYLYTALKNPGILTAQNPDSDDVKRFERHPDFCRMCKIVKTEDVYHCEDCEVCISGYDHHCPWTGKCIGKGNVLPFYMFLGSTVVYMVFCILITVDNL